MEDKYKALYEGMQDNVMTKDVKIWPYYWLMVVLFLTGIILMFAFDTPLLMLTIPLGIIILLYGEFKHAQALLFGRANANVFSKHEQPFAFWSCIILQVIIALTMIYFTFFLKTYSDAKYGAAHFYITQQRLCGSASLHSNSCKSLLVGHYGGQAPCVSKITEAAGDSELKDTLLL